MSEETESIVAAADRLGDKMDAVGVKVDDLTVEQRTFRKALRASRLREFVLIGVAILSSVALILGGVVAYNTYRLAKCNREFAVATSERSRILTDGRHDLDQANAVLLLTAIPDPTAPKVSADEYRRQVLDAGKDYRDAFRKYTALLEAHPVPDAPTYDC
jgi:hypothetical protein